MTATPGVMSATRTGTRLNLRVIPRAPRTAVEGVRGDRLVVRVTAPPVDHAANDAVVDAVAAALALPRRAVRITAGLSSRNKTVEIDGVPVADVRRRLANL